MARLSRKQKDKLIKKTSKTYVFRKVFLFVSIAILLASVAFILFSAFTTFVNYLNLHNDGKITEQIWIEISHQWWSPIKATNEQEWQPGQPIVVTFSIFAYVVLGCLGLGVLLVIISAILVATVKSQKKTAEMVCTLNNDTWKGKVLRMKRKHNKELDACQEYVEVQMLPDKDKKKLDVKNSK